MSKIFCAFVLLCISSIVYSAPPVFLEDGHKICTLNNVGAIPKGALKYPVYQKVCRHVHSSLGDPIEDEEQVSGKRSNSKAAANNEDEVEKVRRAILSKRV